ncbi:MAG: hypothetical protein P1P82_09185 [Bacteroidales bacterium]|nr:hypothetical protein [Bacteroidales bacterium]MDT8430589.1 hypothetical protein [Bacteroidales bacterium]
MKKIVKTIILAVPVVILLTACDKENQDIQAIEGTYTGILLGNNQLKTTGEVTTIAGDTVDATAEVYRLGENEIGIHCYGSDFDTTFSMNYYAHHDSAYVCFTGEQFEHMYGHMPGSGHMGGMMEDMMHGETEWMHHLDDEHTEGDEHFGGFDMEQHSFGYTFQLDEGTMTFQGTKQ